MNKVAQYLQDHIVGEVLTSNDVRQYFATDASIFTITPLVVAYPKNENDIRKIARFTWQLAERGRVIPITSRGKGSDKSGAAIGKGIILAFPAHMNKIVELDSKSGTVVVEPGIIYGRLQQTLFTHGRHLPAYPSSIDFSTIGGAVANNASGEKTVKYGDTRKYTKELRIVLANGEVIETKRLSKRELNKKMGLSSFEGEIYRNLDKLIEDNKQLINQINIGSPKNTAGYQIADVKQKNSFDLTPLLVGSQGTLGIVTEATLSTEPHNPHSTLIAAYFNDTNALKSAVSDLLKQADKPSMLELVDNNLLNFIDQKYPNQLKGAVSSPYPKYALLIELDTFNDRTRKKNAKKVIKIINKYGADYELQTDPDEKDKLLKLKNCTASVLSHNYDGKKALPIIDDASVPTGRLTDYFNRVYELFSSHKMQVNIWGRVGDGTFHVQPFLDMKQIGDRQKIFKMMDEYYNLVIDLGGSTSGELNDGRLRAPYLEKLYGSQVYELFQKIKTIFDPYGTLNPGVKIGVTTDDIKPFLREEYILKSLYDNLPQR